MITRPACGVLCQTPTCQQTRKVNGSISQTLASSISVSLRCPLRTHQSLIPLADVVMPPKGSRVATPSLKGPRPAAASLSMPSLVPKLKASQQHAAERQQQVQGMHHQPVHASDSIAGTDHQGQTPGRRQGSKAADPVHHKAGQPAMPTADLQATPQPAMQTREQPCIPAAQPEPGVQAQDSQPSTADSCTAASGDLPLSQRPQQQRRRREAAQESDQWQGAGDSSNTMPLACQTAITKRRCAALLAKLSVAA